MMSTQINLPPLPRRIWWPWDEPAGRVGFYRAFRVQSAAQATLYLSASGPFCVWLDDRWLPVPECALPPWRQMRRFDIELTPGRHALNILVASSDHGQPFLLACLDWKQSDGQVRIGTDDSWHAVVDPPLEWMPAIPEGVDVPTEIVPEGQQAIEVDDLDLLSEIDAWRRAFPPGLAVQIGDEEMDPPRTVLEEDQRGVAQHPWGRSASGNLLQDGRTMAFEAQAVAYDGVWAEPWGMPADAPEDFGRMGTGWQVATDESLTRVVSLHQGLTAAGTGVWVREGGSLRMRPVAPFPQAPPKLYNERPAGRWNDVHDAHSRQINSWLDHFEARAPHAVLDLGQDTFGRVRVRLKNGGPAMLALTTGESVLEVHRYDRRATDVFTLNDGQSFTSSPAGFRFVKLMALGTPQGMLDLEPLRVQHIRYPVTQEGRFRCSDPLVDRIWQTCTHTLHLCMQNEIWDAIKRDQLPWMGELAIEALSAYHAFGDARLVRRSLAVLGEIGPARARPLEQQLYPGLQAVWKTRDGELNGIPSHTLWWVVGLADYVRYTGDHSLVVEYGHELLATLRYIARHIGSDGLWHMRRNPHVQDWEPLSIPACEVCCHLLACLALREGMNLTAAMGRLDVAEYSSALMAHMVDAARRAWFGSDLQELRSVASGRTYGRSSEWLLALPTAGQHRGAVHHVYAMAVRSGCLTSQEAAEVFALTQANDSNEPMIYRYLTADLEAAALVGETQWGLDVLRRHWGSALEAGMTTFWEIFDPSWLGQDPHGMSIVTSERATYGGYRTAHCHGGAVGPVSWLHRAVLGVTPVRDGFSVIRFAPALGDLEWAEGTIPTPRGPIHVSLRGRPDALPRAEIHLPHGIELWVDEDTLGSWEIEEHRHREGESGSHC